MRTRTLENSIAITIVVLVGVLWEIIVQLNDIPVYILPAPGRIISTMINSSDVFIESSIITLIEAIAGLGLGMLAGICTAILLGLWPRLERGVMTLAIFIKSTPLIAIAPLLTIWLGFGILPKIIITSLLTFFPVLVNVLSGLQSADSALLDTFHSWHANRVEINRYVRMPNALPYLFAALKVSGPLSLIGAVIAEWTGASGGLGRVMWLAYTNLNLPFLFAAVFILSAMGMAIYAFIVRLERKIVFWAGNV